MTIGQADHCYHVSGKTRKQLHCLTTKLVLTRTTQDGCQKEISCPPCLPDYQEFMCGVDLRPQNFIPLCWKKVQETLEESFFLSSGSMLSKMLI